MTQTIDFIYDFASPNAYFVHKTIDSYLQGKDVEVRYLPVLLGGVFKLTGNSAPMVAFGEIKGKMDYEFLEIKRFIKKHSLARFKMNSHFPVNTILMMRGACFAQDKPWYTDYVDACFTSMWENDLLMSDEEVFLSALNKKGLDGELILNATKDPAVKQELMAATDAAVARGVFGIPTLFVDEEMYFGKERLGQIADSI